jgi:transposase InsO family protein
VSPKTAAKWVGRYRQEGRGGLADRSSRPRTSPRRTHASLWAQVEALRRQRWSGFRIAQHTGLSRSTVSRILRHRGLHRLQALDPAPPPRRYEYTQPGGLLHLDIKALGRFHRPQFRHHPWGYRRSSGAGWEYLHVAIDDYSRIAFALLLPDQSHRAALAFLRAALAYYATLGISIQRVMTDNGGCYRSRRFRHSLRQLHLRHLFTRPYTPRTNGKAERFIQTALREWAYGFDYLSSRQRSLCLSHWLQQYNYQRPHASLNHAPPISRLAPVQSEQPLDTPQLATSLQNKSDLAAPDLERPPYQR